MSRCEEVLHAQRHDGGVPVEPRRYSRFRVFSRSRYIGGVVRSWTLATRGGPGLVAIGRRAGDQ